MRILRAPPLLAALALACGLGSGAQAATITITGAAFGTDGTGAFAGYGSSIGRNNVVNFGPSGLVDNSRGQDWVTQGNHTPSAVTTSLSNYGVAWYFNGSESGDVNKLFYSNGLLFQEGNQNNRFNPGNDPGWQFVGTTTGTSAIIPFSLTDGSKTVANGANNTPSSSKGSLMFGYLNPQFDTSGNLTGWKLTKNVTDWFAFGFNDPGSSDRDFDDFMGVGHVTALGGGDQNQTPLPAALPLMASVLAGSYLIARRRRREGGAVPV